MGRSKLPLIECLKKVLHATFFFSNPFPLGAITNYSAIRLRVNQINGISMRKRAALAKNTARMS